MKNNLLLVLFLISASIFSQTTAGDYKVENLDSNSSNSDFGTAFYGEDKIIFSSSKKSGILKAKWKINKQPFLNLYVGTISTDGSVSDVKQFSNRLNTKFHEASVSFTPNQKEVFFTRDNYYNSKLGKNEEGITNLAIYKASVAPDGSWSDVRSLPFNNVKYSVGSPSVSKDGKKIYFASDMPGSLGLTDIYVVDILENDTYGIPKNLGKKINTTGSDNFPFIDKENVLYFSSDSRKDGMGGLDVYAAKMYDSSISDVLHLGSPVNSSADDFAYILKNDINEGYFSSNRDGGKGDDDIYHFKASPPLKIECDQVVTGTVKDLKTGDLIDGAIVVLFDDKDGEVNSSTTGADGSYKFTVDCKKSYKIVASKENYKQDSKTFKTEENPDAKLNINLEIDPIPAVVAPEVVVTKEKVIVNINPIYFDFNKANIREDAVIELDKVVAIMQKYPELIIEGGSHTDVRGVDAYNLNLSSRRAKSTVKYIISKGIDANRITAKGYGETQIINQCTEGVKCSESEHQQNRRTEFVIQNPDVLGYY